MQEINAAYEQIKDPDKSAQTYGQSHGGYNYGGYGGYNRGETDFLRAAAQYIRFGRFHEALTLLARVSNRDARWYYLSAVANDMVGNQVTALEHIRKAVSMDPANPEYLQTLEQIENGGLRYRQQAGNYQTFRFGSGLCLPFFMCCFARMCCC